MKKITIATIEGRHDMPVDNYIFDESIADVTNTLKMYRAIDEALKDYDSVTAYVTGLTVVTTELCFYCFSNHKALTLMHFNSATGEYYPQEIVSSYQSKKNKEAEEFLFFEKTLKEQV